MTLHKQIEAARALVEQIGNSDYRDAQDHNLPLLEDHRYKTALSTLPAKPMTEDELIKVVNDFWQENAGRNGHYQFNARVAICALRDAGALYCSEEK